MKNKSAKTVLYDPQIWVIWKVITNPMIDRPALPVKE